MRFSSFVQEALRTHFRKALATALLLAGPYLLFLLLDLLFPFPWEALERPPAVMVLDRHGEPLRFFLPADQRWRFPVRLSELPPEFPRALVASEDQRFWRHPGIDLLAVARAAWTDVRARRVVSGASTISMQIARMVEPGPRTLPAKLRESFRALQLEHHHSKRRILEIYLNLAPYGGNLEGVGVAAWFYFGKRPDQLSLSEIALLTALPRAPSGYDPVRRPRAAERARDRVLAQLAARGAFPQREIEAASRQPVPRVRSRAPFAAPHFAQWMTRRYPGQARLRTSLDSGVQRIAEEQVRRRAAELRDQGISNAAVVVIDNQTRSVRALVGSADFFAAASLGQVNGAVARRSPGSTLKPFLYAMAMDEGRILPDSYLLDIPTDFGGYVAENYDERYRGRVTVRDALIQSLNACAIRLLSEVGLGDFLHLLRRGGLATLDRPPEKYGLPLVLGAGEVTLLDLVDLYATLAEGGVYRPVRLLEPEGDAAQAPPEAADRLFSRDAARAVTEILTDVRRPDLPESWDLTLGVPAVAWKTGTSYGHRDAWAVGFSARTTIGVWVGNFDGRPRKGISGSQHAGPLLFDLFRALEEREGGPAPPLSADAPLDTLEVCADSHELPGPFCPRRLRVPYLPGRSKLVACTWHRRVLVDSATGDLLAGDCLSRRPHEFRLLTVYPAELVAWWRAQGNRVEDVPRLSPECRGIPDGEPPHIVSPDDNTPYRVRRDAPPENQRIPLIARAGPGTTRLFWYQDGLLVAATSPGESRFLDPRPGEHRLVVTDDLGRSDGITYTVE